MRGWRRLTHDVAAFDVELDRPLDFDAGQFALLTVPGIAGARAYSMVNFERPARRLSFVAKQKPGGAVSEWLFGAAVEGSRLGLFAPLGHATFPPGLAKHVLCIAGGSGIAGMLSILERAGAGGPLRRVGRPRVLRRPLRARRLLPGRAAGAADAIRVPAGGHDRALGGGRAHDAARGLPRSRLRAWPGPRGGGGAHAGRFAEVRAYVAGPPPMVDASLRLLLREARLSPADIRYDKFS